MKLRDVVSQVAMTSSLGDAIAMHLDTLCTVKGPALSSRVPFSARTGVTDDSAYASFQSPTNAGAKQAPGSLRSLSIKLPGRSCSRPSKSRCHSGVLSAALIAWKVVESLLCPLVVQRLACAVTPGLDIAGVEEGSEGEETLANTLALGLRQAQESRGPIDVPQSSRKPAFVPKLMLPTSTSPGTQIGETSYDAALCCVLRFKKSTGSFRSCGRHLIDVSLAVCRRPHQVDSQELCMVPRRNTAVTHAVTGIRHSPQLLPRGGRSRPGESLAHVFVLRLLPPEDVTLEDAPTYERLCLAGLQATAAAELASLGSALGESLIAADLAIIIAHKRQATLRRALSSALALHLDDHSKPLDAHRCSCHSCTHQQFHRFPVCQLQTTLAT